MPFSRAVLAYIGSQSMNWLSYIPETGILKVIGL